MKKIILALFIITASAGCDSVSISFKPIKAETETPVVISSVSMEDVLKDVSKEDTEVLFYLFGGMADYVERVPEGMKKNSQAFSLFRDVKNKFGKGGGWLDKEGDMNDPNDVIEAELKVQGMEKTQSFNDESRAKFVKTFRLFEEASLKSWKAKK